MGFMSAEERALGAALSRLGMRLRERLAAGAEPADSDRVPYEDVVLYLL